MTNLTKYNGNFLEFADQEIDNNFNARHSDSFSGIAELDLNVFCSVAVFPGSESTRIEIDSEDLSDFTVRKEGDRLVVKQKGNGASVTNVNGVTTISGGNVVMVNGEIWVNGQKVDRSSPSSPAKPSSRIRIYTAHGIDLNADLKGVGVLASKVVFAKARVHVSGQFTVGLAAKSANLKVSGQGENFVFLKNGNLKVSLSGQGNVRVKGEWQDADISVSGMGSIKTEGICHQDYDASVSGMGSIFHNGKILGRARKSKSGMGTIDI